MPGWLCTPQASHNLRGTRHSFNLTDIHTIWTETRAVMGKGQTGIVAGLEDMRQSLPFPLRGIDSDNGSEFLNAHLVRYCQTQSIQFTRGRPYKKNDNAHIEQKNWTHVRRLIGWDRYDSAAVVALLNDLYRHDLRLMMNLFQPSVNAPAQGTHRCAAQAGLRRTPHSARAAAGPPRSRR